MKWFKDIFTSPIEMLPRDYCYNKTSQELLEKLRTSCVSRESGNMIVLEILERLVKKEMNDGVQRNRKIE